jgi:hypothetical protein
MKMQTPSLFPQKNYKLLFYFILAWTTMNILQAYFTGLDGDETYYWTYSRHLQWGYFDHPPMVALSIKLGELFGHGSLFTRFGAILFSAGTIYFGFKALPEKFQNVKWYIIVFASVLIFHIYGFISTPDPPLLFFTALFFYAYKRYLQEDKLLNILFLAASIIGMMYSKYHGVLPVFFTFLSNPRLALKRSAWLIVIIVFAAFIPHLWWQYSHDWPTVRYHLFERNKGTYRIDKTTNYILGQLLIFGPFTTIVALILIIKRKIRGDVYLRAHTFTFFGILLFFLLSSFSKNVEPHWTLTAGISFIVLVMQLIECSKEKFRKIFFRLATINIFLIVITRIPVAFPISPINKVDRLQVQIYSNEWADSLYKHAAGTPVVFVDNYTYPSLYLYYHPDELATCYSTVYYRKNNYTLQNHEAFNNKTIYTVRQAKVADDDIEVKSRYVPTFLHRVDSFKAVSGLKISWLNKTSTVNKNQKQNFTLELLNPMNYSIDGKNLFLNYTFSRSKTGNKTSEFIPLNETELQPGYKKNIDILVSVPSIPGKYKLIFSFDQQGLGPTFASPFYEVEVK